MTYYNFKEGVYLVEGHINGCIYDLNSGILYEINKNVKEGLRRLVEDQEIFHESFKPIIQQLVEMELLETDEIERGIPDIRKLGDETKQIEFAWINVVDQCNLQCIHCFQEASPECSGEMELADFKKVIDDLVEHGVKNVQLFGGEPLILGEKLTEMIAYSREYFSSFEIFTNGTLIDDYWIDVFKKYQPMIRLSLHSYIPEEQDKVTTVSGSYEKLYQALDLLKENGINHVVSMTLMNGVEVGEKNIDCKLVTDVVKLAGRSDINKLDEKLLKKKLITQKSFTRPLKVDQLKKTLLKHTCYGTKVYIDTNLDVYPCASERDFKHGNLGNNSLNEILKDEIIFINEDKVANCQHCEYRYACSSCRSDRWNQGKMDQPWFCTYDPIEGVWEEVDLFINKLNVS